MVDRAGQARHPICSHHKFFKGHFDFVTSVGLDIDSVETLPSGKSDHMPILVSADYGEMVEAQVVKSA